jgi:hypothetical protein
MNSQSLGKGVPSLSDDEGIKEEVRHKKKVMVLLGTSDCQIN